MILFHPQYLAAKVDQVIEPESLGNCYRSCLAGTQVDGNGDMFQGYQPFPADHTVSLGNAHPPVNRLTLLIGARDVRETVTEPEVAFNGDTEIGDLKLRRAFEMREEVRPILAICVSAAIFLPWQISKFPVLRLTLP